MNSYKVKINFLTTGNLQAVLESPYELAHPSHQIEVGKKNGQASGASVRKIAVGLRNSNLTSKFPLLQFSMPVGFCYSMSCARILHVPLSNLE